MVGGDTQFVSPVAVTAEQLIADGDHRLHAFDLTTFQERWRVALPGSFLSPTIVDDTVYIRVEAGDNGFLIALNRASGEERWQYKFASVGSAYGDIGGHVTSPVVAGDQLFAGAAQRIYAFNRHTGEIRWEFASKDPIASSPAQADGAVYFADYTHLYALDQTTGTELWRFDYAVTTLYFAPIVTADLVIAANSMTIFALARSDGKVVWQRTFDQEVIPAAATATQIYAKSVNRLWALDPANGEVVWAYQARNFISLPAITQDQIYIITRADGGSQLRALRRADGAESWKTDNQPLGNSAPVAAQGAIYVRTVNGGIVGYRPKP